MWISRSSINGNKVTLKIDTANNSLATTYKIASMYTDHGKQATTQKLYEIEN